MATVQRSNLVSALRIAIMARREFERQNLLYTRDSALVAGWEETLKALERGEHVQIV